MPWPESTARRGLADYLRANSALGGIIVSEEHRFLYMKPPKTGGTSILRGAMAEMACPVFNMKDHPKRYENWISSVSDGDLKSYRVFAFVRNPWDRAVSIARYFRLDFRSFVCGFEQMMSRDPVLAHHAQPQHRYTHFNGVRYADVIGRFENLNDEFQSVMRLLELSAPPLKHLNRSSRGNFRDYYDVDLLDRVREIYRQDIDLYSYQF